MTKKANFKKVESLMKKIKTKKIDLIILPELFSTGFTMNNNPLAEDPNEKYNGHSQVIDPTGKIIKSSPENKERIIICNIDFSLVEKVRKEFPLLKDRKL